MVTTHNHEFVNRILKRYRTGDMDYYRSASIVYRVRKENSGTRLDQRFVKRLLSKEIYVRVKHYEKKYYQQVTHKDNRKFIRTVEQIYSQPGDKKQLVYMFQKLGVVTRNQDEWKKTKKTLEQYEEEIMKLKKQVRMQEDSITKLTVKEEKRISTKVLTREVMDRIKSEIRMERLRYGLDI